ncbi:beta-fructofuranosidase [Aureococcus anophagefferens]|nr:beta-fructofuranosidase [Aureococcus anophagefferens]
MRPGRPVRLLRLVAVVVGARGQAPVPNFLVEGRRAALRRRPAGAGEAVLSLGDACGVRITAVGDDFACEKYRQCTLKWTSARGAGPLTLEVVAWDTSLATTADVVDDGVDTFVVREGGVGDGFIARLGRGGNCAPATRRFAVFAGPSGATTTCVDARAGNKNMQHDFNVHVDAATGEEGPCGPGVEACDGDADRRRSEGPRFHLKDRLGCGMNDPAGPFFDAESGVVHVFFQKHVAVPPGGGPVWGHFATKDLRRWAQLPVALWNGPGDDAVFTGSAAAVGGAPRLLAAVVRRGGAVDVETYAPADAGDALLAAWAPRGRRAGAARPLRRGARPRASGASGRRVDAGYSYAAKDVRVGDATLLLAWVQVAPRSALSLRRLRFDAAARVLAQYPADGALDRRRLPTLFAAADPGGGERVAKTSAALRQSDVTATFTVPGGPPRGCGPATFGVRLGPTTCTLASPGRAPGEAATLAVACASPLGGWEDAAVVLAGERDVEVRVLTDWTFHEVFVARGRVAMTVAATSDGDELPADMAFAVFGDARARVEAYAVADIAASEAEVREAPRSLP